MKDPAKLPDEQHALFQLAFNESNIPMGIAVLDLQNPQKYMLFHANKAFFALSGMTSTDLPMDFLQAVNFLKGIKSFKFFQVHQLNSAPTKSGIFKTEKEFFKVAFVKLTDTTLMFTFENISNLQAKKVQLAEKKRQLKESQELAQLGYWVDDHKEAKHYWSPQVFQILGITPDSIKPSFQEYLNFVEPAYKKQVLDSFNESILTKTGFMSNHNLLLKNGSKRHVNLRCYTNFNSRGEPSQTVGILQDVTAFETTKEKLIKSETIFRSVFENAPIAIVLIDENKRPTYANIQFSDITGYSMDEILERGVKDFTYPDDFSNNDALYKKLFNNEVPSFSLTKRYLRKDGNIIWVKAVVSGIRDSNGNTTLAIAMVQDISAEKKASEALIKSEYRYRTLIDNANDGIGLFDLQLKPIIYNSALYSMLGYSDKEFFNTNILQFGNFHPDDVPEGQKALNNVSLNIKSRIEVRLRTKDGEYKYFSISYIPVIHEEKPAVLIFRRDVTKRKIAEAQNEEYRLFLETIMDNLPVSFFAKTTPDFRYIYWNLVSEHVTGITSEDALGKTDADIQQSKQLAEQYLIEDQKLLKNKRKLEKEHSYTNYLGEVKHFKTIKTLHESSTGNPIILGLSMDVTQLKEAELQIEQSTQMLKEAQKIAQLGYWEYDVVRDLFFDNAENRAILGITQLPYFLNSKQFKELIFVPDQEAVIQAFLKCIANNTAGNGIIRFLVNNQIKHIAINYKPVTNEKGEVIKLRGTCLDITKIRQSEIALRESEKRLKQAEHIAKVGYWDYNYTNKTTFFSDEVWNILEMPTKNESFTFKGFMDAIHPGDQQAVAAQFYKSNQTNLPFEFDFRIITHNHNIKFIKAIGTFVKTSAGDLERSIGTFQDVTELRKSEFELLKQTERIIDIQKISKTGFIEVSLPDAKAHFSDSMAEILETDIQTIVTIDAYHKFIHPKDADTIKVTFNHAVKDKNGFNIQYRLLLSSGKIKYVNEICRFVQASQSNPEFVTRIIQDITNLKVKEKELTQWVELKKSNQIGTWEFDSAEMNYIFSDELLLMLDIPLSRIVSFQQWIDLIHPEDRFSVEKILETSFSTAVNFTLTYRIYNKLTQNYRYIQDSSLFQQATHESVKLIGTIRDITQNREMEHRLKEHLEIFKAVTENSLFGTFIFQNNKHIYVNNKWAEWLGKPVSEITHQLSINDLFKPETTRILLEIFILWTKYVINKDYQNELLLKPKYANDFLAEVYIKEIQYNNAPAFLIIAKQILLK